MMLPDEAPRIAISGNVALPNNGKNCNASYTFTKMYLISYLALIVIWLIEWVPIPSLGGLIASRRFQLN